MTPLLSANDVIGAGLTCNFVSQTLASGTLSG